MTNSEYGGYQRGANLVISKNYPNCLAPFVLLEIAV